MTTIVIEKSALFTDSMHIRNKGIDASRNTKIALNDSKTIAFAYTGVTLPETMLRRMIRRIEFEFVRKSVQVTIDENPAEESFKGIHEMLNRFYDAIGMKDWGFSECLALSCNEALHLTEGAAMIVTSDDYTGIGCYIPSYAIYRKMGLSPLESFAKIFDFSCMSAGPVNMVHASSLCVINTVDYIKQVNEGISEPVLRAVPATPTKKPVRRSPKSTKTK